MSNLLNPLEKQLLPSSKGEKSKGKSKPNTKQTKERRKAKTYFALQGVKANSREEK